MVLLADFFLLEHIFSTNRGEHFKTYLKPPLQSWSGFEFLIHPTNRETQLTVEDLPSFAPCSYGKRIHLLFHTYKQHIHHKVRLKKLPAVFPFGAETKNDTSPNKAASKNLDFRHVTIIKVARVVTCQHSIISGQIIIFHLPPFSSNRPAASPNLMLFVSNS